MTDLDQFAAAALKGLLANPNFDELDDTDLATRAYEIASAMTEKRDHWNGIVAPTLTAEERGAVEVATQCVEAQRCQRHPEETWACEVLDEALTTLRDLLDRMK
jgi:hypothetical protein